MYGARILARRLYAPTAAVLALSIFALDVLSPLQGAVAVLYTTVVVLVGRTHSRGRILSAAALCAVLAFIGYCASHWNDPLGSPAMRLAVSLIALGVTTALFLRQLAESIERERADARYRTIFTAAGFPIWESDWSGAFAQLPKTGDLDEATVRSAFRSARVRNANNAAAHLFGLTDRAELIGSTVDGFSPPIAFESLARIYCALRRGETALEEETCFVTSSGETIDVLLQVSLPPDHDGWKRVLVMAADVTERNRAQTRLAQSQAELTHMSRVTTLGQIAASIAHEVNQPLSAIITYARSGRRWLEREAPGATEVGDCLDHISSNAARAADVIAGIRELARKADPSHKSMALKALIEDTEVLLRRDLQIHDVVLRITVAPDLPPVMGDRVQLQQVLMNLVLNAQQAMADLPTGQRDMCLTAAQEGDSLIIEVTDCGTGIAGDPETLFRPFFTTKDDGMGIGLAICRSILEQHFGMLTAHNNTGGGASFRLRLPAALEKEAVAK